MTIGRCRLCLEERDLIKAHVIPRPFWPLDGGTPKLLSNKSGVYPARSPQGVYDPGILCQSCDAETLGRLDQHAIETLLRGEPRAVDPSVAIGNQYPEADPQSIYLFAASMAWRASVSRHDFFAKIKLGPYEEIIRQMIREPNNRTDAVEVVIAEFEPGTPFLDPHQTRFDSVRFNLIYANRFVFYIKTDKRPCPAHLEVAALSNKRPVTTVRRLWHESKERAVMQSIVRQHPSAFPTRSPR